jgi:RND family efflux transporter MFP subunit
MRVIFLAGLAWGLVACSERTPEQPSASAAPVVRIASVSNAELGSTVRAVGTVELKVEVQLGFTSPGRVARVAVNEGDFVQKGQLLATLDTTNVAADLASAVGERNRAAAELARSEKLMREGWITRPRLESARAALIEANARVSATRFQRNAATIFASGPGIVLSRFAEPGQVVAAGTPVLTVGEMRSGFVLRLPLTDRDASRIVTGAFARVNLAALGNVELTGRVIEIAGRADPVTGTFEIAIALPNDPRLRSGQIGQARVNVHGSGSIGVPPTAMFAARAGEGFVYVVDRTASRVRLRRVQIAELGDDIVYVTSGLSPDEWVATSRIDRLKDGMAIKPEMVR